MAAWERLIDRNFLLALRNLLPAPFSLYPRHFRWTCAISTIDSRPAPYRLSLGPRKPNHRMLKLIMLQYSLILFSILLYSMGGSWKLYIYFSNASCKIYLLVSLSKWRFWQHGRRPEVKLTFFTNHSPWPSLLTLLMPFVLSKTSLA
jgi:hypothetical protein